MLFLPLESTVLIFPSLNVKNLLTIKKCICACVPGESDAQCMEPYLDRQKIACSAFPSWSRTNRCVSKLGRVSWLTNTILGMLRSMYLETVRFTMLGARRCLNIYRWTTPTSRPCSWLVLLPHLHLPLKSSFLFYSFHVLLVCLVIFCCEQQLLIC